MFDWHSFALTGCYLLGTAVALTTVFMVSPLIGPVPQVNRNSALDGLRGFLGFSVFLYHATVWQQKLRTGSWAEPTSTVALYMGQASVAMFFMVTGFLFFSKLLEARHKPIDWLRTYVSRFLRLTPLYLFLIILLLANVLHLTAYQLNQNLNELLGAIAIWMGFTVYGIPNLNGLDSTSEIVAGVTWSLKYEWGFYFSLPLLALVLGCKTSVKALLFGLLGLLLIGSSKYAVIHFIAFSGGIGAAFLVQKGWFTKLAQTKLAVLVVGLLLVVCLVFLPSPFNPIALLLLSTVFFIIASGNTIFGILSHTIVRQMGELTYGFYLLHGVFLFMLLHYVVGIEFSRSLSFIEYWAMILGLTPVLVIFCLATYRLIEMPFNSKTASLTSWIRARFSN
jgi:peptidoglycan/LPS O-acetylase OafA/YrhL